MKLNITIMVKAKEEIKKLILVDLDGVLNEYDGDFDENFIPPPRKGAAAFLKKLNKKYNVTLFTTRPMLKAAKWLFDNKMDKYIFDITNIKIPAYLYIDDRSLTFRGNYEETLSEIEEFSVFWKTEK